MQTLGALIPKILPGALAGGGFLGNWLNQRKQNERANFLEGLAKDPSKMNAYVSQFQKPLAAGLTQNVGNGVQAYLGERGLSETPGISAEIEAQALAPFQQQQQQMGINEALASLGLMPQGGPKPADLSGPLAMLMKQFQKPAAPAAPNPVGTDVPPTGIDLFDLLGGSGNVDWGNIGALGASAGG